jgi:hypothetical protein
MLEVVEVEQVIMAHQEHLLQQVGQVEQVEEETVLLSKEQEVLEQPTLEAEVEEVGAEMVVKLDMPADRESLY